MPVLAGFFDFFTSETTLSVFSWTIVIVCLVTGFLGTFLPILPGTTLIYAGALIHYFAMGMEASGLAWQGLVFMGILYILSLILDWFSGAIGARWFGSSKWGIIGAIIGGIVGLFFHLPGLIIGPILGVFLFEILFAKKHMKDASNSTIGTVVGGVAGMIGRVILAFGMIAWYVGDVFVVN
ncbi:MAG: hypothetical protein CMO55_20110 [Verrucomicrobiales bacterium]|nr:hypothetical protein [Verrucomicrobiales bacterium]